MMKFLFIYLCSIFLLMACSQATKKNLTPDLRTQTSNAFIIPPMQLMPVSYGITLDMVEPLESGHLSTVYKGANFKDLQGVEFSAAYLKGYVRVSKNFNGTTLSKQLIDTPLEIMHFAVDKEQEIYIVTKQEKIYKFITLD